MYNKVTGYVIKTEHQDLEKKQQSYRHGHHNEKKYCIEDMWRGEEVSERKCGGEGDRQREEERKEKQGETDKVSETI